WESPRRDQSAFDGQRHSGSLFPYGPLSGCRAPIRASIGRGTVSSILFLSAKKCVPQRYTKAGAYPRSSCGLMKILSTSPLGLKPTSRHGHGRIVPATLIFGNQKKRDHMDSLTQIVLGAAVGEMVLGKKVGN